MDYAPEFAIVAGIPIFTTYFYIGEILGFSPKMVTRMKAIAKFYGYTGIETKTDIDLTQFINKESNE
jgi:hypothetical protein